MVFKIYKAPNKYAILATKLDNSKKRLMIKLIDKTTYKELSKFRLLLTKTQKEKFDELLEPYKGWTQSVHKKIVTINAPKGSTIDIGNTNKVLASALILKAPPETIKYQIK